MSVFYNPLLHLDREPEGVDSEGDDGEKEPLYVVAEKTDAGACEDELLAINDRMLCIPTLFDAYCPGGADSESEYYDDSLENSNSYHAEKSAGKLRFHICLLI